MPFTVLLRGEFGMTFRCPTQACTYSCSLYMDLPTTPHPRNRLFQPHYSQGRARLSILPQPDSVLVPGSVRECHAFESKAGFGVLCLHANYCRARSCFAYARYTFALYQA